MKDEGYILDFPFDIFHFVIEENPGNPISSNGK